jgi:hypothetical protein
VVELLSALRRWGYIGAVVDFSDPLAVDLEAALRLLREFSRAAAALRMEFWPGVGEAGMGSGRSNPAGGAGQWLVLWEQDAREPIPRDQRDETLVFLLRRDGPVLLESVFVPVAGQRPLTWPASLLLLGRVVELPRDARDCAAAEGLTTLVRGLGRATERGEEDRCAEEGAAAAKAAGGVGCAGVWLRRSSGSGARSAVAVTGSDLAIDEGAHLASGGRCIYLPWVPGLAGAVMERHGLSLLERLPELLWRRANGRHQDLRWAYRETLAVLASRGGGGDRPRASAPGPLAGWCVRRGLRLAGSFGVWGGLAAMARQDAAVWGWAEEIDEPWLVADEKLELQTVVQAATLGRVTGRMPALLFSAGARSALVGKRAADLTEWCWRAELLLALGVARWIVEAVPAANAAESVPDEEVSPGMGELHGQIGAVAGALAELEGGGDVALLDPLESAWAVDSPVDSVPLGILQRDLEQVIDTLLLHQRQVDLIGEEQLERIGVIEGNGGRPRIRVGGVSCKIMIVPPVARVRRRTRELIERFLALGGPVVVIRRGGGAQWSLDADSAALLADNRVRPLPADAIDDLLPGAVRRLCPPPLWVRDEAVADLPVPVRIRWGRRDGRLCAFLVSLVRDHSVPLRLHVARCADRPTRMWEPRTGRRLTISASATTDRADRGAGSPGSAPAADGLLIELPPGGSLWLESAAAGDDLR